jgi:hypothetical protein
MKTPPRAPVVLVGQDLVHGVALGVGGVHPVEGLIGPPGDPLLGVLDGDGAVVPAAGVGLGAPVGTAVLGGGDGGAQGGEAAQGEQGEEGAAGGGASVGHGSSRGSGLAGERVILPPANSAYGRRFSALLLDCKEG